MRVEVNRRPRSALPRQAFTLVELMVALTAGSLLVGSVYMIGASSSRYFQEQHRIAQAQMALRTGAETLRRDLSRAGFLGVPNSSRASICIAPARHIQAIEFFDDEATVIPNAAENLVSADRVRMVGNYATADRYQSELMAGNRIVLNQAWQSFRRSFVNMISLTVDDNAFTSVFRSGRMLHLFDFKTGMSFFVTITTSDSATASVTFSPALPIGTSSTCLSGFGRNLIAAPLSRIEYYVGNLGGVMAPTNSQVTGTPTQLIRREIAFDAAGTPMAGTERVVVEYAVNFNLEFILDQQTTPGAAPNLVRFTGALAQPLLNDVNINAAAVPHRLRSILFTVSARTPDQDPSFPFVARSASQPLTRFRADSEQRGASRVRTLVSEVFVPNIAAFGIRP